MLTPSRGSSKKEAAALPIAEQLAPDNLPALERDIERPLAVGGDVDGRHHACAVRPGEALDTSGERARGRELDTVRRASYVFENVESGLEVDGTRAGHGVDLPGTVGSGTRF